MRGREDKGNGQLGELATNASDQVAHKKLM